MPGLVSDIYDHPVSKTPPIFHFATVAVVCAGLGMIITAVVMTDLLGTGPHTAAPTSVVFQPDGSTPSDSTSASKSALPSQTKVATSARATPSAAVAHTSAATVVVTVQSSEKPQTVQAPVAEQPAPSSTPPEPDPSVPPTNTLPVAAGTTDAGGVLRPPADPSNPTIAPPRN